MKIGAVGCGGRLRGVVGRLIKNHPEIELAAFHDPNEKSIKATQERFPEAEARDSYQALLDDDSLEWICIGSWNCFHREQSIAAFEAGKHVFCEKPLALTTEDCEAIEKAWRASGKQFFLGLVLRYSPHYQTMKQIIDSGEIGKLISMEFNETLGFNHGGYIHADWRRLTQYAGTHLLEKCCHDIDLVHWLVGETPSRVASFGGCNFFTPENVGEMERVGPNKDGKEAFKTWALLEDQNPFTANKDVIDNQVAILEFPSNLRSTFHTNCSTNLPERRMYFCGSHGTMRADVLTGTIEVSRIGFDEKPEPRDSGASGGHGGADQIMSDGLADSMLNDAPPLASVEEGLRATRTANAIDKAMETGTVVTVEA